MKTVKVKLIAVTGVNPLELASHAALKCYQAEDPEWGKVIDVESRLFNVSHHTTLQHFFFTFSVEGISVGDITFGLHLTIRFIILISGVVDTALRCFWSLILMRLKIMY